MPLDFGIIRLCAAEAYPQHFRHLPQDLMSTRRAVQHPAALPGPPDLATAGHTHASRGEGVGELLQRRSAGTPCRIEIGQHGCGTPRCGR